MRQRFQDRAVVIIGASSGIGAALGRAFAREGADLVLAARRVDRITAIAAEIERDTGRRALPIRCDVTKDGDIEAAMLACNEQLGPASVVIANAGFAVSGPFVDLTPDDVRRQFETNVLGVLRTAWAAMDDLTETGGVLAIVGSVASYTAVANAAPYAMSKFAVRAFADSLRAEIAPRGVAVSFVVPGYVASEIRRVDNDGRFDPDYPDRSPAALVMPAPAAARAIVDGIARRRREIVFPIHARVAVLVARLAPGLLGPALRWAWLRRAVRGEERRAEPPDSAL